MSANEWRRRLFASIDSKDVNAFTAFLAQDATFRYGSGPEVAGRDAIRSFVEQVFESFRACAHDVRRSWDLEDCRICEGVVTYTRHDGRKIALPFCNLMTMRGELVSKYEIFVDPTPLFAP